MKQKYLECEKLYLSPYACLSTATKGRAVEEEPCPLRTEFQRDRDRIIHCKSFRRLKHKTQVFIAPTGDHYRTRMTHTLEVMQIARTMARCLELNEDLAEAISFGHDLGHTPFGHIGERVLNSLTGHFSHNEESLRVVDVLENDGKGLNLTYEVRNGILEHKSTGHPETLEGKVVSFADRIAYLNHDIDDAIRAGMLSEEDIPSSVEGVLGVGKRAKINTLVKDVIENSYGKPFVCMSKGVEDAMTELRQFMFRKIYFSEHATAEEELAVKWLSDLFDYLYTHPYEIPELYRRCSACPETYISDYIAGMTDTYVIFLLEKYFGYKWNSKI